MKIISVKCLLTEMPLCQKVFKRFDALSVQKHTHTGEKIAILLLSKKLYTKCSQLSKNPFRFSFYQNVFNESSMFKNGPN